MMGLLAVIPRPVPVRLGGRDLLAAELTLGDWADLQAWAEGRVVDAFEAATPTLFFAERDKEWKRLIANLIDEIEVDPLDDLMETDEGMSKLVFLSLKRHNPSLTEEELARVISEGLNKLPSLTWHQTNRIKRIALGRQPKDLLRSLIDGPSEGGGEPTNWAAIYSAYLKTVTGPAPRFEDLTFTQLAAINRGDKDEDEGRSDGIEVARRRAEFFAEIEEE